MFFSINITFRIDMWCFYVICMPSIAPIILGKALVVANPLITSSTLLPSGHVIKRGANLTNAFITLLTAFNAVALPTLNFSQMDLYII